MNRNLVIVLEKILPVIGAAGIIFSTVQAIKDTKNMLKEEPQYINFKLNKKNVKEVIHITKKYYYKTITIAVISLVAIGSSYILNKRLMAGLSSTCALLANNFNDYRETTKKLYGEKTDEEIMKDILKKKRPNNIVHHSDDEILIYDIFHEGRRMDQGYYTTTLDCLYYAEEKLNLQYQECGYVSLNDFYDLLGVEPVEDGDSIGWSMDSSNKYYHYETILFTHSTVTMDDGLQVTVLYFPYPPSSDYLC